MTTVLSAVAGDERQLIRALRQGDEEAFGTLVATYHSSLVRVAQSFVRDRAIAEEVAQEAWLGVIRGLGKFRGDSTLKTWIFRILTNRAKARAVRERRSPTHSALELDSVEPAVDPGRFLDDDHPQWPGHWASPPASWSPIPEERLLAGETMTCIKTAIDALPPLQQQVITLRDVEGWTSDEACELLDITETNQRVLLHRARARVRAALETYLETA